MITFEQYFSKWENHPDASDERKASAVRLLFACASLERLAILDGVEFPDNPATDSGVSGATYGGFRPKDCPQGSEHSSHKEGLGVDRYDPSDDIDKWCMMNSEPGGKLEQCGIFIEHPKKTKGWSHWTVRPPGSGKRVFWP